MLREAHIYLAEDTKPAIVAPTHHNRHGILYEQDEAFVVPDWRTSGTLGPPLRSALQRFSFLDRNLRDTKLTDWAAYRASRCRSVRAFQSSYLCICVRAANEAEILYVAEARPVDEEEITLSVIVSHRDDVDISRKIVRLYEVCSRWSSAVA